MDDQKVILQMTSTQVQEDGQEAVMKLTTSGTLHRGTDSTVLEYEETGDGGMTGQASIEMKGDTVMLVREGEASMRLILRQGCKYISTYSTPFGRLDMEALPTKVMYVMGEKDGRIELEYHMHMQNQYLGMNRVSVQFHPQA